ncbi:MAG: hypothetical protein RIC89_08580 [Pseudomonadales bacterium]
MKTTIAKALKQIAIGGTLAAVASTGFAATQGSLGFTSTGDLDIDLTVSDEVRINNLADITLGPFTGADVSGSSPACVYRNGGPDYQVTATGDGALNAFTLSNGTDTVPYSVTFTDTVDAVTLASGTAAVRTGAEGDPLLNCSGGDNASIGVSVTAADASGLPQDTYIGTLTLMVAPN